ncbi:MAG: hypothetical protein L6R19_06830 [Alphaproteobacteria bacterium]|nr:hypothetical protein [Alphaproteobacteria bacterium]
MTETKKHPHAEALYEVFQQEDMTYGVRVTIPDSYPTTVTSFAIAEHREKATTRADLKRRRDWGFAKG